jgi:hypothetical protein
MPPVQATLPKQVVMRARLAHFAFEHHAQPFQWRLLLLASVRALKYHFAGFETGLSNQQGGENP